MIPVSFATPRAPQRRLRRTSAAEELSLMMTQSRVLLSESRIARARCARVARLAHRGRCTNAMSRSPRAWLSRRLVRRRRRRRVPGLWNHL